MREGGEKWFDAAIPAGHALQRHQSRTSWLVALTRAYMATLLGCNIRCALYASESMGDDETKIDAVHFQPTVFRAALVSGILAAPCAH